MSSVTLSDGADAKDVCALTLALEAAEAPSALMLSIKNLGSDHLPPPDVRLVPLVDSPNAGGVLVHSAVLKGFAHFQTTFSSAGWAEGVSQRFNNARRAWMERQAQLEEPNGLKDVCQAIVSSVAVRSPLSGVIGTTRRLAPLRRAEYTRIEVQCSSTTLLTVSQFFVSARWTSIMPGSQSVG